MGDAILGRPDLDRGMPETPPFTSQGLKRVIQAEERIVMKTLRWALAWNLKKNQHKKTSEFYAGRGVSGFMF